MADYFISGYQKKINKYSIKDTKDISSIFLAGSPGAGKTEFLDTVFKDIRDLFIIINIDEYRKLFEWYQWENSSDFQQSSVHVADKILKYCFKNNLNFIFDGTFRNFNKVEQNLNQCKKYQRSCSIVLIYQDPRISFYYTFLRKLKKQRNVPIEVFVDGFYGSIENTFKAKKYFPKVHLLIAHKKYHLLNNKAYHYDIDDNTKSITAFSKKYRIGYKSGDFVNKNMLVLDIGNFYDTLVENFKSEDYFLLWFRRWLIEKVLKIFQ